MHNSSANKITAFAYVVRVRLERKVNTRLLSSESLIINYPRILLLAYVSDFTSVKVSDTVHLNHSLDVATRSCMKDVSKNGLRAKSDEVRAGEVKEGTPAPLSDALSMFCPRFN